MVVNVRWNKPLVGWFKLNGNGASMENPGNAGGGGLIRDGASFWVKCFSRSLGIGTSMLVECWALRNGLFLAIQLGTQNF